MLSRIALDPRRREVRRCVYDAHALHRLVMRGFPDGVNRAGGSVLHRLEYDRSTGGATVYVQSEHPPDWSALGKDILVAGDQGEHPTARSLDGELAALAPGNLCLFRLRANVTRKIRTKSGPDGQSDNGQRVPLRDPGQRIAWLVRKAALSGFSLVRGWSDDLEVRVTEEPVVHGGRDEARLTLEGVCFDGMLRVEDSEQLREAVRKGIGPGKAFGFGLLSLRRVDP